MVSRFPWVVKPFFAARGAPGGAGKAKARAAAKRSVPLFVIP